MGYQPEHSDGLAGGIDCYWQADLPESRERVVYPSLPEPYINLFFPVGTDQPARIKGISSSSDFFDMRSALFGVRLYLRGFYQLHLGDASLISDRLLPLDEVVGAGERALAREISGAADFETRVEVFRAWYRSRFDQPVSSKQQNVAEAFEFLIENYQDPTVISTYAEQSGISPRTISRWFSGEIGIPPKRLARIARFHTALPGLHDDREAGFWFDCGYYDQAHFIREFKEFTGITPEEYARMVAD